MLRGVLKRLAARFDDEADAEEADDARFAPSPLDVSVRYAHGTGSDDAERELAALEETARALEERHRDG